MVKSEAPKEDEEASAFPVVAVEACPEEGGCAPEAKRSRLHLNNMSTKIALKDEIKLCSSILKGTQCPFGESYC